MAKSMDDLCCLAAKGAGLVIDQQQYTEQDLTTLGAVVEACKGTLLFLYTHARAVIEAQSNAKTFPELCHRAQEGKVLTIDISDPRHYPQADLLVLTALVKEWGSRLYLLNAHTRDTIELGRIAEKGGKFVTLDLSQ
jgi:hypothetical protein